MAFGGSELLDIGGEVGGLYWWMTVLLPGYVYFRYPAKLFVVAALGMSMLAAHGWDEAWQSPPLRLRRCVDSAGDCEPGRAVRIGSRAGHTSSAERQRTSRDRSSVRLTRRAPGGTSCGGLVQTAALSVIFLVMLRHCDRAVRPWVPIAALLLTGADLATAQNGLVLYAPAEYWQTEPELLKKLPQEIADYRVFRQIGPLAPSWKQSFSRDRYTECLRWDRETLWPKYELPYDISLVEASATMISSDYETSARRGPRIQRPSRTGSAARCLRLGFAGRAGRDRFGQTQPLGMSPLARPAEGMTAGIRSTACPRAWIVHEVEQLARTGGSRSLATQESDS